ncbi:YdcF family protein [bacterium SCSIO 12741]|nr:YdcF family protein [bacterium SCSIO 12741]
MFHAISKILHFMSMPITWIFICMLLSLFLKGPKRKKRWFLLSVFLFYFFSNGFIQDEVNRLWEPPMSSVDLEKKYDVAIVLGGYSIDAPGSGQINLMESGDRLMMGLHLYHQKKVKKILLCGGRGSLTEDTRPEGMYVDDFIRDVEIPSRDLWLEGRSKNTHQNAVEAKKVLDSLGFSGSILLITSASHMPRSQACFKKVGLETDAFCVDGISGERKFQVDHLLLPSPWVLKNWNNIIHEWIGLFVYLLMGYI